MLRPSICWRRPRVKINQDRLKEFNNRLVELSEKVKDLGSKAGLNLTIAQGGNLTEKLQALSDSPAFGKLKQELSQQLSQLGINATNLKTLKLVAGSDFGDLVQKLQNLSSSRGT